MQTRQKDILILSDSKKRANDFKLAKEALDYYEYLNYYDVGKIDKFQENYEIHRGSWSSVENMSPSVNISLQNESVNLGGGKLRHYPIINRVSNAQVSDGVARRFSWRIKDTSTKARNERERIRIQNISDIFRLKYFEPKRLEILKQIEAERGQEFFQNLSKDQASQLEKEINNLVVSQTPEEILEGLEKVRTSDEQIATIFLKHVEQVQKLKAKFDTGLENAVVTGETYYRISIRHKEPIIEVLNPMYVTFGGSQNATQAQDAEYATYTQYLTLPDIMSKYSIDFEKSTLKKLLDLYSPIPGKVRNVYELDEIDEEVTDILADNPQLQDPTSKQYLDIKALDGQDRLKNLYKIAGKYSRKNHGIKESYVTWKWMRKAFAVRRLNPNTNEVEIHIRDEHYKIDKTSGDLDVTKIALPQVWHGVKLGDGANCVYLNVEPVPIQYNSVQNPFDVKLPIFGGPTNVVMNNNRGSSFIDLGKPFQFRYNVLMKKMDEYMATDAGKVIFGTVNIKPDGWSWGEWYKSIFVGHFGPLNVNYEGLNAQDRKPFYVEDMSRTIDIKATIEQLLFLERKIVESMHYNYQKLGEISPYATNQNTQVSVRGADRLMYRFFNSLRLLKEEVMNYLLNITIKAYSKNEYKKNLLLDDFMKAHFENNFEPFSASEFGITVVDDLKEEENLELIRQLALTLIQNSEGSEKKDMLYITMADSTSEIMDILERSDRKLAKERQATAEREQQMIELQRQAMDQEKTKDMMFKASEAEKDRRADMVREGMRSTLMQKGNDTNENKIPDSKERDLLKYEFEQDKLSKDRAHELIKQEKDHEHEIELEKMRSKNKKD